MAISSEGSSTPVERTSAEHDAVAVGTSQRATGCGDTLDEAGKTMPRVLHVLDTEEYAGRESVVETLASAQRGVGYDVRVVCTVESEGGDPPFVESARAASLPVEVISVPPRSYLREWTRLVQLCRTLRPDIMHTHGYRPDVVAGSAAAITGVASVSTLHGFVGGGWKNRMYEAFQCIALRRYDAVVAVSEKMAHDLTSRGLDRDRIHYIRNAWGRRDDFFPRAEARRRLSTKPGEFHVGWVGRLSREKGLDVLLEALAQPRFPNAVISVVGDGAERAALTQAVDRIAHRHRVRWHGVIPRAYRLFPAFDVFVLSSRTEGTPVVLLEAMAAGVPVVATRVGGVPDAVSDREALLVPPEDPGALAEAVRLVQELPEEARDRSESARDRLESEMGVDRWVAEYLDVYRRAVRSRNGRSAG